MRSIFYLLLLISLSAYGQTSGDKIKPEIKNTRTLQHVNIPGTKLYIIPPSGFKVSASFTGLQSEKGAINVSELDGGNFYTNAATFTRQGFEQKGVTVFDYQEVKVGDYPAKYVFLQAKPESKLCGLVFGDTTFSTMVMAEYDAADGAMGKNIVASFNTIWYDKNKKIGPFETAKFTVENNTSKFRFCRFSASIYLYTIGGVDNLADDKMPMAMIMQFPGDNAATAKDVALEMVASTTSEMTDLQVKDGVPGTTNGCSTYEMEVSGILRGKHCTLYWYVITDKKRAIVLQGRADADPDASVAEFKKLAKAIRISK